MKRQKLTSSDYWIYNTKDKVGLVWTKQPGLNKNEAEQLAADLVMAYNDMFHLN